MKTKSFTEKRKLKSENCESELTMKKRRKFRAGKYSINEDVNIFDSEDFIITVVENGETVIDVECGTNKAKLTLEKLWQGSKGQCIDFQGSWLTPNEFQYVSGRETAKDWKRSIRHQGKSIKLLLSKGYIKVTADDSNEENANEKSVKEGKRKRLGKGCRKRKTKSVNKKAPVLVDIPGHQNEIPQAEEQAEIVKGHNEINRSESTDESGDGNETDETIENYYSENEFGYTKENETTKVNVLEENSPKGKYCFVAFMEGNNGEKDIDKKSERHNFLSEDKKSETQTVGRFMETSNDPYQTETEGRYRETSNDPYQTETEGRYRETSFDPYQTETGHYRETSNDPYQTETEGQYKETTSDPYQTNTEGQFRETSNDPYQTETEGQFRETSNDPYQTETEGQFRETSNDPYQTETEGQFRETSNDPYQTETEGQFRETSNDPYQTETDGQYKETTSDPYQTETEGRYRETSNDLTETEGRYRETSNDQTETEGRYRETSNDPYHTCGEQARIKEDTKENVRQELSSKQTTTEDADVKKMDGTKPFMSFRKKTEFTEKESDGTVDQCGGPKISTERCTDGSVMENYSLNMQLEQKDFTVKTRGNDIDGNDDNNIAETTPSVVINTKHYTPKCLMSSDVESQYLKQDSPPTLTSETDKTEVTNYQIESTALHQFENKTESIKDGDYVQDITDTDRLNYSKKNILSLPLKKTCLKNEKDNASDDQLGSSSKTSCDIKVTINESCNIQKLKIRDVKLNKRKSSPKYIKKASKDNNQEFNIPNIDKQFSPNNLPPEKMEERKQISMNQSVLAISSTTSKTQDLTRGQINKPSKDRLDSEVETLCNPFSDKNTVKQTVGENGNGPKVSSSEDTKKNLIDLSSTVSKVNGEITTRRKSPLQNSYDEYMKRLEASHGAVSWSPMFPFLLSRQYNGMTLSASPFMSSYPPFLHPTVSSSKETFPTSIKTADSPSSPYTATSPPSFEIPRTNPVSTMWRDHHFTYGSKIPSATSYSFNFKPKTSIESSLCLTIKPAHSVLPDSLCSGVKRGATDTGAPLDLSLKKTKTEDYYGYFYHREDVRKCNNDKIEIWKEHDRSFGSVQDKKHRKLKHLWITKTDNDRQQLQFIERCSCAKENIDQWPVERVFSFVKHLDGCSPYSEKFREFSINGRELRSMTRDDLIRGLGMKVGPAIVLSDAVTREVKICSRRSLSCRHCSPVHSGDSTNPYFKIN